MALECVCVMTERRGQRTPQQVKGQARPGLRDIDLCEIAKRSGDESVKHNDHECHLKGEKRQNLINKLRMYLDDYDDRPVMKGKGKSSDDGKALGQTGFGPMIKYPGYVDYDHPYFRDPYNKLPTLASTVGQRRDNPCTSVQTRNWDSYNTQSTVQSQYQVSRQTDQVAQVEDGRCRCAERRGEVPTCPAAGRSPTTPQDIPPVVQIERPRDMAITPQVQTPAACQYICIPLPDDL